MDNQESLSIIERGRSCRNILADPIAVGIYEETRDSLAKQIIQAHPRDQIETTILKSMLLGLEAFWGRLQGLAAYGEEEESVMNGTIERVPSGPL